MSKSRGNTVDPQALIKRYGADTVRLFTMFAAPPEQSLEWSDSGVDGANRFLRRLWALVYKHNHAGEIAELDPNQLNAEQKAVRRKLHQTIHKVSDDIGRRYTFNTAIAAIMELLNLLTKSRLGSPADRAVMQEALEAVTLMLAPIVPHICHQLWQALGHTSELVDHPWPQVDDSALAQDSLTLIVQVNGKLRAKLEVAADSQGADIEAQALSLASVQKFTQDKTLRKVIYVPGKLINIVVGG